jgi:hypothetical protein
MHPFSTAFAVAGVPVRLVGVDVDCHGIKCVGNEKDDMCGCTLQWLLLASEHMQVLRLQQCTFCHQCQAVLLIAWDKQPLQITS